MAKKLIASLIAVLFVSTAAMSLVGLSIGTVSADTSGDFQYSLINSGTAVEITGYTGSGVGNITIPNSIAGEPVTMIGDNVFLSHYHITGVTIPSTVTYIGYWAFNSCIRLSEINIPSGVTYIGPGAFNYCWALKSVTIPSSVTTLGAYAFANCLALTSVTIPSGVATMGDHTFYSSAMTSATINSQFVSDYAFSSCGNLASVTFGSGFDSIGNYSFYGCSKLPAITIPSTVTFIGSHVFGACPSLAITVNPSNPDFASSNGALYNQSMTTLIAAPGATGVFTIPNGVTSIGDNAFENGIASSVTIPNSVTTIGNNAFYACNALTSVTIGSGVTTIGYTAFEFCTALTNMVFYGLASPTNVQVDSWIYDTHGLFGHAYYSSNFPAPGHVWAGLTMGSYLSNTSVVSGTPAGLVAKGGPGFIFLNWTAPVNVGIPPLTQYAIYRGTSSGGYGSPLSTFGSNTATYNDTTATPGTQYFYVIKAINTAGSSPASDEATAEATTSAQSVPGAPTDLQAVGHSGYVILTWAAPANAGNPSFTQYYVYRGATAGSLTILAYVPAGTLTYNDTTASPGNPYVYVVKAVNTFGSSPASNEATVTATSGPQAPSAPQNVAATNGNNSVVLHWNAPTNVGNPAFTSYDIYRGATADSIGSTPIGSVSAGTLTYTDATVVNGNTYVYVVKAVNTVGSSPASNTAQGNPSASTSTPAADNTALYAGVIVVIVVLGLVGVLWFMKGKRASPPKAP